MEINTLGSPTRRIGENIYYEFNFKKKFTKAQIENSPSFKTSELGVAYWQVKITIEFIFDDKELTRIKINKSTMF